VGIYRKIGAHFIYMKRKFYSIQNKSIKDLGVESYKALWEKAQSEGYDGISFSVETKFVKKSEEGDKKSFHAIFSSSNEDRHGDVVHQVFHLVAFQKNPVYLDSHNYDSIEHIIGRITNIGVTEGKLQGDVEFATMNPKGALAERMAENGYLHASSIGFIPMAFNEDGDIIESELLEISAVSVPANADALFEKTIEPKNDPIDTPPADPIPAPTPEPTPTPEPVPTPEPEAPVQKATKKAITAKVVSGMVADRQKLLKSIAKHVQELVSDNKVEKKRKIFQAIRKLESSEL
jgi:hypothetical protein